MEREKGKERRREGTRRGGEGKGRGKGRGGGVRASSFFETCRHPWQHSQAL